MTKSIKIGVTLILTAFIMLIMSNVCLADKPPIIPAGALETEKHLLIPNPGKTSGVPEENFFRNVFLPDLTRTVITLAGGLAFLFIIVGGIQILTAYGNDEQVTAGKKTITYAIVGLVIAILSYAIVAIISAIQLGSPAPQQSSTTFLINTAHAQADPVEAIIPTVQYPTESGDKASKIAMVEYLPTGSWQTILASAIKIILGIAGSLTVVAFTVGGVMMIMAQGDEEDISKGKKIIYLSLLALIFIAGAYAVVLGLTQLEFFQ